MISALAQLCQEGQNELKAASASLRGVLSSTLSNPNTFRNTEGQVKMNESLRRTTRCISGGSRLGHRRRTRETVGAI